MTVLDLDLGPGLTITTIGYSIYDAAGVIIGARVTAGINTIVANQVYSADVQMKGTWKTIIWDDPIGNPTLRAVESLTPYVNEILLRNRSEVVQGTGANNFYEDDDTTVFATGTAFEDSAGATPYAGTGIERRNRLA